MKSLSQCAITLLVSDSFSNGAGDWHCSSLSWLETKGTSIYTTPAILLRIVASSESRLLSLAPVIRRLELNAMTT